MIMVVLQLVTSAIFLALWIFGSAHNPLDLYAAGFSVGCR